MDYTPLFNAFTDSIDATIQAFLNALVLWIETWPWYAWVIAFAFAGVVAHETMFGKRKRRRYRN